MTGKIQCANEPCQVAFIPTRPDHRFCSDACRAEHRRNTTPGAGKVTGLRQIKNGDWSVTIHLPQQPELQVGQKIAFTRD